MKKLKCLKKTLLSFLLLSNFVHADEELADICSLKPKVSSEEVRIKDIPSYFYKVHPNGKDLGYSGEPGNKMLNISTGETSELSGNVDPVFTPDGKFVSNPYGNTMYFAPLLNIDDPDGGAIENKEVGASSDPDNYGTYQSIGQKKGSDEYRMISDNGGASLHHYKANSKGHMEVSQEKYRPCQNISAFPTDLPMLSRDGKYLSVLNKASNTTHIYHLKDNGNCDLAVDLGISTGKVSFNYDNSQIAFHVSTVADDIKFDDEGSLESGDFFTGIRSYEVKDSYVVNLEESEDHKLHPTTWAKVTHSKDLGNGFYFPDFSASGDLFLLEDRDNFFAFHKMKKEDLNFVPFGEDEIDSLKRLSYNQYLVTEEELDSAPCTPVSPSLAKQVALGFLWGNICHKNQYSPTASYSLALSLNKNECEELLTKYWNESRLEIFFKNAMKYGLDLSDVNLNLNDLLAACPDQQKENDGEEKIIGSWDKRDQKPLNEVFEKKCLKCHNVPLEFEKEYLVAHRTNVYQTIPGTEVKRKFKVRLPALDMNNMGAKMALLMKESMQHSDDSKRMPLGGSLTEEEVKLFKDFFDLKELEGDLKGQQSIEEPEIVVFETFKIERGSPAESMMSGYSEQFTESVIESLPDELKEKHKKFFGFYFNCAFLQQDCRTLANLNLESYAKDLFHIQSLKDEPDETFEEFLEDMRTDINCHVKQDIENPACHDVKEIELSR